MLTWIFKNPSHCELLLKTNLQNFLAKDHLKQEFVESSKARADNSAITKKLKWEWIRHVS